MIGSARTNRAQINSQILVYVLSVIIMGMVLLYGFNAIKGIRERAAEVERITFKSEVRSAITSISSDYGSTKSKSFTLPQGFSELCFVNYEFDRNEPFPYTLISEKYWVITDRVGDVMQAKAEPMNMFLCPNCLEQDYVGNITLIDKEGDNVAFLCFKPTGGTIRLKLEGKGDKTQIS